jgi:hypothetical protein
MWTGLRLSSIGTSDIAHETAVCRNQPKHSFTGKEKTAQIRNRPIRKHVMFLRQHKEKQFSCGHSILTAGVFVTQLPNNAEISILRIVWVTIKCCFTSDVTTLMCRRVS